MKKKIAVFTFLIALCYIIFSSYSAGTAASGFNCSGAKASVTTCGGSGSLCHGSGGGTTTYIRVDSAGGVQVGSYVPGITYTVTVGGTNPLPLPKFGFQFTAVKGMGAAQTLAGTYAGFPLHVTANSYSGLLFVEQTAGIDAPTPGTYQEKFQWVAPSLPGSGIITMYLTLLAVNGNNFQDTNDVSGNVSITLLERTLGTVTPFANSVNIKAFPNPVTNNLNLSIDNAPAGTYSILAYDLNGKLVTSQAVAINNALQPVNINTTSWPPGIYKLIIEKDENRQQITIVKQ